MLAMMLASCSALDNLQGISQNNGVPSPSAQASLSEPVEVTFHATLPEALPENAGLELDIVDEITGLAINPARYVMEALSDGSYESRVTVPAGSLIRYRYIKVDVTPAIEYTSSGRQVRYRILHAIDKMTVTDSVNAWTDLPYQGAFGRIEGKVTDRRSGAAVGDVLVSVDGAQTVTTADGYFRLDRIAPGIHNLVAVHQDGAYYPFQQGAVVSSDSMTPALIAIEPLEFRQVTFNVKVPENTPGNATLRLLGDTFLLGNTFSDLNGGMSVLAARAPQLKKMGEGEYTTTLDLPIGFPIRYKYSLGDGFWNAEHNEAGDFVVRELVISSKQDTIEDSVFSWQMGSYSPLHFKLTPPAFPRDGEHPSLQLNPFGWMEPIPMWPVSAQEWDFVLFSPLELLGDIQYRVCRNEQCPQAAGLSGGETFTGKTTSASGADGAIDIVIDAWNLGEFPTSEENSETELPVPSQEFSTGIEFSPAYHPSWLPYFDQSMDSVQSINARQVILAPTWTATDPVQPVIEPLSGSDPAQYDLVSMSETVTRREFQLVLYPQIRFPDGEDQWWSEATKDAAWWQTWFDRYRMFILHYAKIAKDVNASSLVIGAPGIAPALPDGKLADGAPANQPADAEGRWVSIIDEVRLEYPGRIFWAIPFPNNTSQSNRILEKVDGVYALWTEPINLDSPASVEDLSNAIGEALDRDLKPIVEGAQKPTMIGFSYSADPSALAGCNRSDGYCAVFDQYADGTDFDQQKALYHAAALAVNVRPWFNGFVARGMVYVAPLADKSSSIYLKPASSLIRSWYQKLIE